MPAPTDMNQTVTFFANTLHANIQVIKTLLQDTKKVLQLINVDRFVI